MTIKEKLRIMYEVKNHCDVMQMLLNEENYDEAEVYKRKVNAIRFLMEDLGFRIDVRFILNKETHKREPKFVYAEVGGKWVYMPVFHAKSVHNSYDFMYENIRNNNRTGYRCNYVKMTIDEPWLC